MRARRLALALLGAVSVLAAGIDAAQAGCGCTKPPPPPASLRPAVAWSGSEVTLFHESLVPGTRYLVRFDSGTRNATRLVHGVAELRRDLADGVERPQLAVRVPPLPLGPTEVRLFATAGGPLLELSDDAFTVAPQPIGIPTGVGAYRFEAYRAAVSRAGAVYLSLDFGDVQHARVFDAKAVGLPLRFDAEDVAFWNIQGFLMQLLGENMPGLFAIDSSSGSDSDVLHYSRHEFNSWFLQHGERASHSVDPSDPAWHLDGTPHIDHDHQLLEIDGRLPNGWPLPPGATPPFTLEVTTSTLFDNGLVGRDSLLVDGQAQVLSYDPASGQLGERGNVHGNSLVTVTGGSVVHGDATGLPVVVGPASQVTGQVQLADPPVDFLPVDAPSGLIELGDFVVTGTTSLGVGSYHATRIAVFGGGQLRIENQDGPVTLYVTGDVDLDDGAQVETADPDPEKFALYIVGPHRARLKDSSTFHGVVYGPDARIELREGSVFAGAFVGGDTRVTASQVLYDENLHVNLCTSEPPTLDASLLGALEPGGTLALPLGAATVGPGDRLLIGRRIVPLVANADGLGALVPADLEPGTEVEVALVDQQGCRSMRTIMLPVEEPPACGLFGVELALLAPLARRLVAQREERTRADG